MKNGILLLISLLIIGVSTSCKQEGCTDPKAGNFSYDAEKDDGSCDYGGCMDKGALNYNRNARTDNGSCLYNGALHFVTTRSSVKPSNVALTLQVGGQYIGLLNSKCTIKFPDCKSNCAFVNFSDQAEGTYSLRYWEIKQNSSTDFDTLFISQPIGVKVVGNECNVIVIE